MLRLSCEPQRDWNNAWLSLNSNFPLGGNWNLNLSPSPCWKALNSRKTAKVTFISDFFLEMQIMNLPWEFPFLSLIGSLSRVGSRHSYIDWQLGHFELTSYKQNTNNDYPRLNMINYNSCTLSIMYFKKKLSKWKLGKTCKGYRFSHFSNKPFWYHWNSLKTGTPVERKVHDNMWINWRQIILPHLWKSRQRCYNRRFNFMSADYQRRTLTVKR